MKMTKAGMPYLMQHDDDESKKLVMISPYWIAMSVMGLSDKYSSSISNGSEFEICSNNLLCHGDVDEYKAKSSSSIRKTILLQLIASRAKILWFSRMGQ